MGIGDELKNLTELHRQGALSDQEFEAAKARVLQDQPSEILSKPTPPTPAVPIQPPTPRKTNGLAIASFVLGLLGMGVGHALALYLGYRAKRQIDSSAGREGGRGLAIAGIVFGWIGVAAAVTLAVLYLAYGNETRLGGGDSGNIEAGPDESWNSASALIAAMNDRGVPCENPTIYGKLGPDYEHSDAAQCYYGAVLVDVAIYDSAANQQAYLDRMRRVGLGDKWRVIGDGWTLDLTGGYKVVPIYGERLAEALGGVFQGSEG